MQAKSRLSRTTLFGFLARAGFPLVRTSAAVVRSIAAALGIASITYAVFAVLRWEGGIWSRDLPWSGALPSLLASPLYLLAWRRARAGALHSALVAMFAALYVLTCLATWPRGAFCPAWYMQPILALLATAGLGVLAGLTMTLAGVCVLLAAAIRFGTAEFPPELRPELWLHTTSLAAVTLASALAGAVVNRLLFSMLLAGEVNRRKVDRTRRALRYRERLLRHAMRIETVGDLAGMVSHQLRNAFQVMLGHVSLAATAPDGDRSRHLATIGDMLDRGRSLLDELMGLAHPEDGTSGPEDLAVLVERFQERARSVMPSNVTLGLERAEGALPVVVDARNLEHALWNLVINARQAMPNGGEITLRLGHDRTHAWVAVADRGVGIPAEHLERIFDPYFTTKPVGRGTGLGLAAVARFARASSGQVRVTSTVGKGTVFWLRFPLRIEGVARSA